MSGDYGNYATPVCHSATVQSSDLVEGMCQSRLREDVKHTLRQLFNEALCASELIGTELKLKRGKGGGLRGRGRDSTTIVTLDNRYSHVGSDDDLPPPTARQRHSSLPAEINLQRETLSAAAG